MVSIYSGPRLELRSSWRLRLDIGDVVFINEERGCWDPPRRFEVGYGIIIDVQPQEAFLLLGKWPHKPNDIIEVMLEDGRIHRCDISDAEVVNENIS